MKHIYYLIAASLSAVCCTTKIEKDMSGMPMDACLNLTFPELQQTKATIAAGEGEKKVNTLYLAVFDSSGNLEKAHECTADEIGDAGTGGVTLQVKRGKKTVWAVANVAMSKFSSVKTLSAFEAVAVSLSEASGLEDFAMKGSVNNLEVSSSAPVTASISLSRFASRISLVKVTNSLPPSYGSMQVKSIYLANVVCNDNISQTVAPSTWCNKLGHKGTQFKSGTVIGNGSVAAENAAYTFTSVSANVASGTSKDLSGKHVYGFRNAIDAEPQGRSSGFPSGGCCSVLYVIASMDGVDYWYPIAVKGLNSNNNYDVELTVTMPGQRPGDDDFGSLIDKGEIDAVITVSDWSGGSSYVETI